VRERERERGGGGIDGFVSWIGRRLQSFVGINCTERIISRRNESGRNSVIPRPNQPPKHAEKGEPLAIRDARSALHCTAPVSTDESILI